ncbi:hypothetical protein ACNTMW_19260 [Planosporangium sp. 12N6]|uniref:hypothetical protein n=1 Tax=Planosporangium spinosum TaxID=3402278 RepID=UPI003CED53CE
MDVDEISNGPAHDRRPGWSRRVPVAVLVVAVGALLLVRWYTQRSVEPHATAPDATAPAPSATARPTRQERYITLGAVCPPVTDGRHTLTVSFTVENVTSTPVTLVGVGPVLPLGLLRPTGSSVTGGSCGSPAAVAPGGILGRGTSLLVTFLFDLPDTCPQPLPVQADIRVKAGGVEVTDRIGVLSDLGGVAFDTCTQPP